MMLWYLHWQFITLKIKIRKLYSHVLGTLFVTAAYLSMSSKSALHVMMLNSYMIICMPYTFSELELQIKSGWQREKE